jgi:hypothetical protein
MPAGQLKPGRFGSPRRAVQPMPRVGEQEQVIERSFAQWLPVKPYGYVKHASQSLKDKSIPSDGSMKCRRQIERQACANSLSSF